MGSRILSLMNAEEFKSEMIAELDTLHLAEREL